MSSLRLVEIKPTFSQWCLSSCWPLLISTSEIGQCCGFKNQCWWLSLKQTIRQENKFRLHETVFLQSRPILIKWSEVRNKSDQGGKSNVLWVNTSHETCSILYSLNPTNYSLCECTSILICIFFGFLHFLPFLAIFGHFWHFLGVSGVWGGSGKSADWSQFPTLTFFSFFKASIRCATNKEWDKHQTELIQVLIKLKFFL